MHATLDWSLDEIVKSLPKDPDAMLAYKLPEEIQRRASELAELSRSGGLSDETRVELKRMLDLDSRIIGLKGKALQAKNRGK